MEQVIPEGRYNLTILMAEKFLPAFGGSNIIKDHGINKQDLVMFEEVEKPYFEVNLNDAEIKDVVNSLIAQKIEADIQVLPLYQDERYQTSVSFNAFVRNRGNKTLSYINSKDEENLAYELQIVLGSLNMNCIHEADQIILHKINDLHPVGWVC